MHDFWKSYLEYECDHALRNVHHLRDLNFIIEQDGAIWAEKMKQLLLDSKKALDDHKADGVSAALDDEERRSFNQRYWEIISEELSDMPPPGRTPPKRGRTKQSKSKNLLDRFCNYRTEILRFMDDWRVPFDNNLAERDIRMAKVKQKISGCFRTLEGADQFCRIRGYISTAMKNNVSAFQALHSVFSNNPFVPSS